MTRPTVLFHHASRLERISFAKLLELNGFEVFTRPEEADGATSPDEADLIIFDLGYATAHNTAFRDSCARSANVVVIAQDFGFEHARMAFRVGAKAFLLYRMSTEALVPALHLVLTGEAVLPSEIASLLLAEDRDGGDDPSVAQAAPEPGFQLLGLPGLVERDVRVLSLVAHGRSNKEIARHLGTTEEMVKLYLRQIMAKINARNRTQAAVWAMQNGLAERGEPTS
ncbi:LuxR C-terminal-related transcriptional regulator [Arenibaculum pallidiluteum]|uniref:LuxR C-terminal-related transcriptional regulator n=1 Tax=Arenibaculum pallidiluteum TaxID=2812559 RepID=UPI001A973285|nr:response regulator transcription factor [Arenibaculum pallidiluteum]